MNKVYKVIWSNVRKCYVVVSEIARNRGKNSTKSIVEQLGFGALSAGRCALPLLLTGFLLQSVPGFASADLFTKSFIDIEIICLPPVHGLLDSFIII